MKKIPFLPAIMLAPLLLLSSCNMVVMAPSGDIAAQQRDLIIFATVLMLIIIVPVIFLTLFFAWRYRASNTSATYLPDWHHSTKIELLVWSAPIAIILVLATVTWIATHKLDPYRPLERIDAERSLPADVKPLTVEVVAMDWKWLFIYPDQGIATVNELAAPVDVPINFKITAQSVMNSFYIPALAGQIYAMPGMQTKLHGVINKEGVYDGFSANYSGAGFSHMRFKFHGLNQQGFDDWVARVKAQGSPLSRDAYLKLEKPSEKEPVRYFASADKALFNNIVNLCADPNKMCMQDMMHIDMMGGGGKESEENREKLQYDNRGVDLSVSPNHGETAGLESHEPTPATDTGTTGSVKEAPAAHEGHTMHHSMPGMNMPDNGNGETAPAQN
ncbi:ubiquinol oxidase subunit II [Rhizobium paknamense]|uniref:Ubiquinol oxidase polypeptide II n=1 Tax=Rhizobium paknamense TaxID=1206817 RepID=A0ABU0IDU5_9HYPH|nr:ubiquinol oxidase subunit II [Rhizobium paknamense]MDQ0456422.1 cytochrome o ubiquinol oxidase subunit 2 [Rhizobium paknamense]